MMEVGAGDDIKRSDLSISTEPMDGAGDEYPYVLRDERICGEHIILLAAKAAESGMCRTRGWVLNCRSRTRSRRMDAGVRRCSQVGGTGAAATGEDVYRAA